MTTYQQEKLQRATRRNPCPVCNKSKWCGFAEDGAIAICMRVSDGAASTAKNGGYVHVLKEREPSFKPITKVQKPQPIIAPIERRHAVYTALLESLELLGNHADALEKRGLYDAEIARNLYASLPQSGQAILDLCKKLANDFDLATVPGFFKDHEGRWYFTVRGSGVFIPVRDVQGRIQACQIRNDDGSLRYLWFSSADRDCGASSGTPIHISRPWRAESTGEAIITEGALKADIVAQQLDVCVVAVAGVTCFGDGFGYWLRKQLPSLHSALVAYDSDWKTKPEVERAMLRLVRSLDQAKLEWDVASWDSSFGKGLDDLLKEVA